MVFNTQLRDNLSLQCLAANLEASGNCYFAMSSVKQDNIFLFSLILLAPKNQNNGLHPSESSDITNTQNWLIFFISGLANVFVSP